MSAHTPGPWRLVRDQHGSRSEVWDAERLVIVAKVRPRMDPKEEEANARLIKAAPDLLKACVRAAELIGSWVDEPPLGVNNVFSELLAAIAAAKGVTP